MSENEQKPPGLFQVMASVLAAFLGVQSDAKRQRDFSQGRPRDFIIVGLVFTLLFVVLTTVFVPDSLLSIIAGAVFGGPVGFAVVLAGGAIANAMQW